MEDRTTVAPMRRGEPLVPPTQGELTIGAGAKPGSAFNVQTAADIESLANELRGHVANGKQVRVTIEVLDKGKP